MYNGLDLTIHNRALAANKASTFYTTNTPTQKPNELLPGRWPL
jgi:hypothetical protein